jgi:hypothetical protein
MRRITLLLGIAIATVLVTAAAVARAAAPTHEWITLDDTFTWNDCGFPVEEHAFGKLHFISWFDGNGVRTRQLVAAPGAGSTYTNPLTGKSVSSPGPYVVHKSDGADSVTVAFTGLRFALPGGGKAYVDSGRDLVVFSDSGAELLSSVGPSADLCEALAATIG